MDNNRFALKRGTHYHLSTGQHCACVRAYPKYNVYWLKIENDPVFGLIERPYSRFGVFIGSGPKSVGNVIAEDRTPILS